MNKKQYVLGFIFDPSGDEILLIKKLRPDWQKGSYNAIGGHIQEGETPGEAIIRETKEECCLDILEEDWFNFTILHFDQAIVYCFVSLFEDIGFASSGTDEQIKIFDITKLTAYPLVNHLEWLIPMALDETFIETEITVV